MSARHTRQRSKVTETSKGSELEHDQQMYDETVAR
jgi:hypothetical protein